MKIKKKIRVLIVDDSALYREFLTRGISSDPDIEVVATAVDPYDARDKIIEHEPDVMTLDVEMPRMNGIEFLRKLMPQYPIPVIVISSVSNIVFDALNAGAVDFVAKPDMRTGMNVDNYINELIIKIKIASMANLSQWKQPAKAVAVNNVKPGFRHKLIAIGASTGGTEAILAILRALPKDLPGIVIVQHMPPVFTRMYAQRLNNYTALSVKEAETGDIVRQGQVLIAPGDKHMRIEKHGSIFKGDFAVLTESVNETVSTLKNVISEISNNLLRIAQNDLDIEHVSEFRGDFAVISDSLNRIIGSLNRAMRDINSAAEQVAVGAGQISAASQTLSQGSEEQASSIEEVTATIAQMAAQVKQNAANATQADELSLAAKNSAIKGNEQMKEMLQAMHDINEASTNISKIIKVIDDIAFQTNILALNAAVEAARAGQYGKGFAVVAEEVRNLAQRSANAAKETTAMIEGSIEKVGIGTKIANNTAQGLYEIVESITKAAELVSQISYASNEQATAISQVNQAVEQVSQVVQTNSATAEETASASEDLSSQAEILKDMVNKFRLREDLGTGLLNTDRMNPDILSAIEEMIDKRDRMQGKKETDVKPQKKTEKGSSKPKQTEGSKNKPQILLDDKEFGKY